LPFVGQWPIEFLANGKLQMNEVLSEPIDQEWRTQLECGLARQEFVLHYQPKVDMRRGIVVGLEALIRWHHPQHGVLLPAAFIPFVEDNELIERLGDWVIRDAMRQTGQWREAGLQTSVGVNISPRHLLRADFIERLDVHLASVPQLHAGALEVEIVETMAIDGICQAASVVRACQQRGVTVALDDFGTGYACLTELRQLPVDALKLDRSFVTGMLDNTADASIVEGILVMARGLGVAVIAEGVESLAHGTALMGLGCKIGQGYCIARPMPPDEVPGWITEFERMPLWGRQDVV
jgi:EAL domain-containing protein (putative c-di-GMP-specific phosphodiesterase class I)